ncbi:hypothetical protein P4493_09710 [Bacillus thuringiensis]|jgi:hypothetical protein|uniref:Uncharacterized protein n=3 Tax=Bacillus thuringiensis TaxID=1428 RepID=A0AB35PBE2_BACTU|nr:MULTISPECIES: hypothetical protein [Bacillus]MEC3435203.1 hypothetical protein [Bacillus cereus]AFQ30441.1 hypothetical protein BTF1_31707 [Bacillus thuringiensis HD-789]AJH02501.1 hypothetical protein AS86_6708 [Bacillus thuringiensis HD1002]AND28625.1 hypothetical protein ATN07_33510 [Bacillus thuringiensis serovar israelensis]EXL36693.1 hypothetical protein BG78_22955 [Bacillus thuringiensis serovar israelensis]
MDYYIVILKSYDSISIFRTKEYNDDVVSLLNWYIGSSFDVTAVFKNAEPIVIGEYVFQTKKEILDELEWKRYMWFDEEGEELEEKIRKLLDALYEEGDSSD